MAPRPVCQKYCPARMFGLSLHWLNLQNVGAVWRSPPRGRLWAMADRRVRWDGTTSDSCPGTWWRCRAAELRRKPLIWLWRLLTVWMCSAPRTRTPAEASMREGCRAPPRRADSSGWRRRRAAHRRRSFTVEVRRIDQLVGRRAGAACGRASAPPCGSPEERSRQPRRSRQADPAPGAPPPESGVASDAPCSAQSRSAPASLIARARRRRWRSVPSRRRKRTECLA